MSTVIISTFIALGFGYVIGQLHLLYMLRNPRVRSELNKLFGWFK